VPVLRHRDKKPAGGVQDAERHFGCASHELIMVGDRYLTDVVYGNRHGMLTVRVAPLTGAGEPPAVGLARRLEEFYVSRWTAAGIAPPAQKTLGGGSAARFVRAPPPGGPQGPVEF